MLGLAETEKDREHYDVWAVFLIGKVFTVYWEFTGSEKVKQSLYRAMKCLFKMMKEEKIVLFEWGKLRWFMMYLLAKVEKETYTELQETTLHQLYTTMWMR